MHQSEKINDTIHTTLVVTDEYNINLDGLISCFTCNEFTYWIKKLNKFSYNFFISRLCKWLCHNVALAAPTILFKGGGEKEDYIIVELYIS